MTAVTGIIGGIAFMVFGQVDGNTAVSGCIISVVTCWQASSPPPFDFDGSADAEQMRRLLAQAPPINGK